MIAAHPGTLTAASPAAPSPILTAPSGTRPRQREIVDRPRRNPLNTWRNIARRHGHVFRMALHNEGDWRMETWQRARRASCHVSIRQSPSCVMPFWTHAKCFLEATKCWVFVAHFSIYSTSRCRCHRGTDIPRLRGHTLQINQVVRTVRHRISCCAPTIHWKCDAQIQNRQIKSPPALWKHLSFQCLGVIVTLNGKSASMLLEPTKNKLKQWRVIEKSVNKCNFFSQIFWIMTKWMKITEKQICEDQIATFKQSHILLYQGLLF